MDVQKLIEILLNMRSESLEVYKNLTESNLKSLMNKYNMLFVGKNVNCIYSNELAHSLNTIFNIPVTNDELTCLIPDACNLLHMKYEPMINVSDAGKPNPPISHYQITLW